MLRPDSTQQVQCLEAVLEAQVLLDRGEADRATALCTACIDSTDGQWAHYVRARARLLQADTMGYCQDMQQTWKLPEGRRAEFRGICSTKDSAAIGALGLSAAHFPGVQVVAKETWRTDGHSNFALYDESGSVLARFVVLDRDTLFTAAKDSATFAGGDTAMHPWLVKSIHYPDELFDAGIHGRVYVRFIVDEAGVVREAKILQSPAAAFSEEVLRVIALMPKWNPGTAFGREARFLYRLPVDFKLR